MSVPALAKKVRLQIDKVSGDSVLLFPEGALVLNGTGAAILRLCNGSNTVETIAAQLAVQYQALPEDVIEEITAYLTRLRQRNLLNWDTLSNSQDE